MKQNGRGSLKSIGRIPRAKNAFGRVQNGVRVARVELMVSPRFFVGNMVLISSRWDCCYFEGGGWTEDVAGKAISSTVRDYLH